MFTAAEMLCPFCPILSYSASLLRNYQLELVEYGSEEHINQLLLRPPATDIAFSSGLRS